MAGNPFTLTFGKEPKSLIFRTYQNSEIVEGFRQNPPEFQVCMITGVRGSGKTVALTTIANAFRKEKDWIVVDLNPERDLLKTLAAELSSRPDTFQLLKDAKINLSFLGLGIEIDGVPPVTDTAIALDKMLRHLSEKGKKILITIDEAVSNSYVREFASQFQIYLRHNYNIFLIMTGLYENIYELQNEKSLTFLYRAPKIELQPLNLGLIAASYKKIFNLSEEESIEMAKATRGYSFAYQALGYICFRDQCSWKEAIPQYDAILEEFVYEKIWSELSMKDREIVKTLASSDSGKVADLREVLHISSNAFPVYRTRLIRKGIVISASYGNLDFALPRFREFVCRQYA